MRFSLLITALIFIVSCHPQPPKQNHTAAIAPAKKYKPILKKIIDSIYPEPDPVFLRKRLFAFFDRHKNEDVFDTTDQTYEAYWGPICYAPYTVNAGHLFSKAQVHAIIFISDNTTNKMLVYLKKKGAWQKIFEDTSIENTRLYPELRDWDGDGIKDISMPFENSWTENAELWLMDRSGEKIHYIKDFVALPDPVLDSIHFTIGSSYVHAGSSSFGTYKFTNYKLHQLEGIQVYFNGEKMDSCTIEYYRNDKKVKQIQAPSKTIYKHVPAKWKDDVEQFFSM